MSESKGNSILNIVVGCGLLAVGLAVFAVRLIHEGAYAMPRGGNLVGGAGGLLVGFMLILRAVPRQLRWLGLASSPVILFLGLYATMAEVEEVVSIYATNPKGQPAELRLWIVDREDGMWVGMPGSKAVAHSLDGTPHQMLRRGETICVIPVLVQDRSTIRKVHALKVEKYAVARFSASIGLYPTEAKETTTALRLDACPST